MECAIILTLRVPSKECSHDADMPWSEATATNENGRGIVAAPAEGLTTGFEWEYFDRLHVGATGWFIAGERGCNVYWSSCRPEYSQRIYLPLVRR